MADHVSFFRAKALPGKRQAVIDQFAKWEREQKPQAKGFVRSILVFNNSDPDEITGAVRWDTSENYFANASRPEQDAWYRELRANLAADPEWFDGTLARETIA
ncbi:MAG: hypothetical protein HYY03_06930 [Chloroflexi bacterium]|nr:hypothetical protein [Chloroflexota bacterium]